MKLWPNPANFSGSQPVSSSSTPPAGANSFQVVTEVALDRGWAAFQGVTLTGWSETIPVTAGSQYAFSLTIAGELQATAGQGGRVRVQYDSGSSTLLWQNPANFSSGGLSHSQTFSPPAGANEMRFGYEVTLDKGWLAFSNASLERRQVAYTMTRKTYFLGSQVIATRVSGDPDGNNGLFYIHTDHLGSTSLMSDAEGYKVETSVARYLPYGGWRTEPTAALTDRAFTGQKENMDIGLYYYNARYYAPYINRFISADTIVPNPTNPQSYNRYSYVRNNPVNFRDPTGHYECYANDICADVITSTWIPTQPFSPFLRFTGSGWTSQEKQMAHRAASGIANRMAETVNATRSHLVMMEGEAYASVTPEAAFRGFFGGPITMHKYTDRGCTVATGCRAWASETETTIYVGRVGFTNHQLMIHEIFHTIDLVILGGAANRALWALQSPRESTFPNRPDLDGPSDETWGFAGGNFSDWQKSRSGASGEEFADMGIGWRYNQWERSDTGVGWSPAGQARANFMNVNMAIWLNERIP